MSAVRWSTEAAWRWFDAHPVPFGASFLYPREGTRFAEGRGAKL